MGLAGEVEHTADRAFRLEGRNLRELFTKAALVIFRTQSASPHTPIRISREVFANAIDRETLLVNWLNELLYLQERYGEIYDHCEVLSISNTDVRSKVSGTIGAGRVPVKAVTFHNLKIEQSKNGLQTVLVVDV